MSLLISLCFCSSQISEEVLASKDRWVGVAKDVIFEAWRLVKRTRLKLYAAPRLWWQLLPRKVGGKLPSKLAAILSSFNKHSWDSTFRLWNSKLKPQSTWATIVLTTLHLHQVTYIPFDFLFKTIIGLLTISIDLVNKQFFWRFFVQFRASTFISSTRLSTTSASWLSRLLRWGLPSTTASTSTSTSCNFYGVPPRGRWLPFISEGMVCDLYFIFDYAFWTGLLINKLCIFVASTKMITTWLIPTQSLLSFSLNVNTTNSSYNISTHLYCKFRNHICTWCHLNSIGLLYCTIIFKKRKISENFLK